MTGGKKTFLFQIRPRCFAEMYWDWEREIQKKKKNDELKWERRKQTEKHKKMKKEKEMKKEKTKKRSKW